MDIYHQFYLENNAGKLTPSTVNALKIYKEKCISTR